MWLISTFVRYTQRFLPHGFASYKQLYDRNEFICDWLFHHVCRIFIITSQTFKKDDKVTSSIQLGQTKDRQPRKLNSPVES